MLTTSCNKSVLCNGAEFTRADFLEVAANPQGGGSIYPGNLLYFVIKTLLGGRDLALGGIPVIDSI
jgi:hypothetical protein